MKETTAFWGTTSLWGAFGLMNIYIFTPEHFNAFWLGWFGTMLAVGIVGFVGSVIISE